MIKIIWLRHGKKAYRNAKGPKNMPMHDPPLDKSKHEDIREITKTLVKCYGTPDKIISSPYLRTVETGKKMIQFISEHKHKEPEFSIDNQIGEFLGNQKPKGDDASLHEETLKHYDSVPILGSETTKEFRERSVKHFNEFKESEDNEGKVIWVITHGFFISSIYEHLEGCPLFCKELRGFCYEKTENGISTCKINF